MNILLDTHIAIWSLLDSPKLTQKARAANLTAYDVLRQIIANVKTPYGV